MSCDEEREWELLRRLLPSDPVGDSIGVVNEASCGEAEAGGDEGVGGGNKATVRAVG